MLALALSAASSGPVILVVIAVGLSMVAFALASRGRA